MSRLILVKHASPQILPERPANVWTLSTVGRQQSKALVVRLAPYDVSAVRTSEEPKAVETGNLLAEGLRVPFASLPGLHENDRSGFPFFHDEDEFRGRIRGFFARPTERIIGNETADEAHARFVEALREMGSFGEESSVVVVSHGAVITLLVSRSNGLDPIGFWDQLGFTSFVVLDLDSFALLEVVHP